MASRANGKDRQMRQRIALEAARIMAESGSQDFSAAKRKAALRLAAPDTRNLPGNAEIEQALIEYQRLFLADTQPHRLRELRETALHAMALLERFAPLLVGPVLQGTADAHTSVMLHVFTDTPEEISLFLMEHAIPAELGERRLRVGAESFAQYPSYHFMAGEIPVELVVFPLIGQRQAPFSPVDGRPMRRAKPAVVRELLEEDGAGS